MYCRKQDNVDDIQKKMNLELFNRSPRILQNGTKIIEGKQILNPSNLLLFGSVDVISQILLINPPNGDRSL